MRRLFFLCVIAASVFIAGCQEEKKNETQDFSKAVSDPNTARALLTMAAHPGSYLLLVFPAVNIMLWSDMYHSEHHRYPESREQLKTFMDAHPSWGLPVAWDNVEDLSFGPPDADMMTLNGTMIFRNGDGRIQRVPFSWPFKFDPNSMSPETKKVMEKELEKIFK